MSSNSSPSDLINETKSKYREKGGWRREGEGGGERERVEEEGRGWRREVVRWRRDVVSVNARLS